MTVNYAEHVSAKITPQSSPIPGQVENSSGGFSWEVNDWTKLDRFLILGCEGGSYYAGERKMTKDGAAAVQRCLAADGVRAVRRIVEISEAGRAPKNDPAIFALALAASLPEGLPANATRKLALDVMPLVCRTGTHLFQFVQACESLRGWGRGLRRSVAKWYTAKEPGLLAYQLVKYQQRGGWSHRDLLRLSKPKKAVEPLNTALRWAVGKAEFMSPEALSGFQPLMPIIAFEAAKRATTKEQIVKLIRDHNLVRECIPTQWLNEPAVWDALLEHMPMTAMIRNLATMTRVGLLSPLSVAVGRVTAALADTEKIRKARVHPIAVLAALKTYAAGRGVRSARTWSPVSQVVDALDGAFYNAFGNVVPTGKRWLLALDVSGSMDGGTVAGVPGLTPRVASAALAMITAAVEPQHCFVAFTSGSQRSMWSGQGIGSGITPLALSPRQRLDDVVQAVSALPMGGTDCALPMIYASENNLPVDAFVVLTDSETWAGDIHPVQALRSYRQKTGIASKLIVCGMVSNEFTIADPNDAGMLDVVGFDLATPNIMSDFVGGGSASVDSEE